MSVTILTAETKYWTTSRKKGLRWCSLRAQSIMAGRHEMAGYTGTPVGDRETCMQILLSLLPFYSAQDSGPKNGATCVGLPSSVKPFENSLRDIH